MYVRHGKCYWQDAGRIATVIKKSGKNKKNLKVRDKSTNFVKGQGKSLKFVRVSENSANYIFCQKSIIINDRFELRLQE